MPPSEVDYGIMKALRLCGEFFGVQRSYLLQIDPDGKLMSNTYEWCAYGIEPQKDQLQDLPAGKYSWQMDQREALMELKRCAGEQLDPHLVDQFILLQETAK